MQVEFWFDPGCPFTWLTSRWLVHVAPQRDLDVDWQPLSLLMKNDTPESAPWYPKHARGRDLLRVVEAARLAGSGEEIERDVAASDRQQGRDSTSTRTSATRNDGVARAEPARASVHTPNAVAARQPVAFFCAHRRARRPRYRAGQVRRRR